MTDEKQQTPPRPTADVPPKRTELRERALSVDDVETGEGEAVKGGSIAWLGTSEFSGGTGSVYTPPGDDR